MTDLHTFRQRQRLHLAQRRQQYVLIHSRPQRQPSRRGLVVGMVLCALGVLVSLWLMFEAALPAGLPR